MRKVWIFGAAIALLVAAAAAASNDFMFQSGDETWINNRRSFDPSALRARDVEHFAAVIHGGRTYVVTNRAALDRLKDLYAPVVKIGDEQAALGSKQAALGDEQAQLGAQQAIIGAQQAAVAVAGDRAGSRDFEARQRLLAQKQRVLGDRQKELGEQQRALGARQHELTREATPKIERFFDEAIASGLAIEVP